MKSNNQRLSSIIASVVMQEKPVTILEISRGNGFYGNLFAGCLEQIKAEECLCEKSYRVDRMFLNNAHPASDCIIYDTVYSSDMLNSLNNIPIYDFIFIADLLENTTVQNVQSILDILQTKAIQQILIVTPEYSANLSNPQSNSFVRNYHPLAFLNYDFSCWMCETDKGNWQFYSVFKKNEYPGMDTECLSRGNTQNRKLRIAYVLPDNQLTGGLKSLLHQMKHMALLGHDIYAYMKDETATSVLPGWSEVLADDIKGQAVVPVNGSFLEYIGDVDVILLGWMNQVPEFFGSSIPVVLWEQGSKCLFGDYDKLICSNADELKLLRDIYRSPVNLLAVSPTVQKVLKSRFNRESQLLYAGIDVDFYHPSEEEKEGNTILLVGNPDLSFKNFTFALSVLQKVSDMGTGFNVKWASQKDVDTQGATFDIEHHIMSSQEHLANLYRRADIFISTSLYEAFSLPPMEAMASGTAVIATDNGGILAYANPDENCLICSQGDKDSFVRALLYLLDNSEKRALLGLAGRETALGYSLDKIALELEALLYNIID